MAALRVVAPGHEVSLVKIKKNAWHISACEVG